MFPVSNCNLLGASLLPHWTLGNEHMQGTTHVVMKSRSNTQGGILRNPASPGTRKIEQQQLPGSACQARAREASCPGFGLNGVTCNQSGKKQQQELSLVLTVLMLRGNINLSRASRSIWG